MHTNIVHSCMRAYVHTYMLVYVRVCIRASCICACADQASPFQSKHKVLQMRFYHCTFTCIVYGKSLLVSLFEKNIFNWFKNNVQHITIISFQHNRKLKFDFMRNNNNFYIRVNFYFIYLCIYITFFFFRSNTATKW